LDGEKQVTQATVTDPNIGMYKTLMVQLGVRKVSLESWKDKIILELKIYAILEFLKTLGVKT
jgi:hypothetical protein